MLNLINKITTNSFGFALKGLILILPLFFLPWISINNGMDNYSKQNLLWLAALALCVLSIISTEGKERILIPKTKLQLPLLFFAVIYIIAGFAGVDRFSSWLGQYNAFGLPVSTLVAFLILFYLIINFCAEKKNWYGLFFYFLASYCLAVLCALLLLFNIGSSSFLMALGNLNDFSVYIAVINIIIFRFFLGGYTDFNIKKWQLVILRIAFCLSLGVLFLISYSLAAIILLTGCAGIYLVSRMTESVGEKDNSDSKMKRIWTKLKLRPTFFRTAEVILVIIFLLAVASYSISIKNDNKILAQSLTLDRVASWTIAKEAVRDNPILGYGPETFNTIFSWHRPADFNDSQFWNLRFSHAGAFIIEIITGSGLLGLVFYLLILFYSVYIIWLTFQSVKKFQAKLDLNLFAALACAWLVVVVLQFLYPANTNLLFLFWLLLAWIFAFKKMVTASDGVADDLSIPLTRGRVNYRPVIIVTIVTIMVASATYQVRFALAEYYFKNNAADIQSINKLIQLNPYRSAYWVAAAKVNLQAALNAIGQGGDIQSSEAMINRSIDCAKQAISRSPYSVVAQETLGVIYREISLYSNDMKPLAIEAFTQAIKFEPTNPVLITELGKLYQANGEADLAIKTYNQALEYKNDYAEAKFALGRAYEDKEDWDKALAYFQELEGKYNTSSVNYEMGKTYFNKKNYDEAIKYFQDVLAASPNNINAVYSIALSFEAVKEYQQALFNYNKALKIDPANQEIKDRIKKLEEEIGSTKK